MNLFGLVLASLILTCQTRSVQISQGQVQNMFGNDKHTSLEASSAGDPGMPAKQSDPMHSFYRLYAQFSGITEIWSRIADFLQAALRELWSGLLRSEAYGVLKAVALLLVAFNSAAGLQVLSATHGCGLLVARPIGSCIGSRSTFVVMAKTKKNKKKVVAKPGGKGGGFGAGGGFGGGGASKTGVLPKITLPGVAPQIEKALKAKAQALVESPKDEQAWLETGAVLVKAREYAEAERVFRAGAHIAPQNEMLTGMALGLGVDSKFYYHGKPLERPAVISADLLPSLSKSLADEGFNAYASPPDVIFRDEVTVDRATDWGKDSMTRGVIFQSKYPVLPPSECAWVIEQVEKQAEVAGGWTTSRHVQAPTTDFPVTQVPAIREWFDEKLHDVIFPMLHARYPTLIASPDEIRVLEAFVVRYDAGEQASLPIHVDGNPLSMTIALNDQAEYEGGGVKFTAARSVEDEDADFVPTFLNADAGGVVTFPGKLPHGGNTVTKGRRYIIPLFIYLDINYSGRKPGWLMEQLNLPEAPPEAAVALARYGGKQIAELGVTNKD